MNIPAAENVYTTRYTDFKGVDFTSQICSPQRFPNGKNFIISDMVEKRPGYECLKRFEGKINGLYYVSDEKYYLVHAEDKLYSMSSFPEEPRLLLEGINNETSSGFYSNGYYYILTGKDYIQASRDKASVINEEIYNKPYKITNYTSTFYYDSTYHTYTEIVDFDMLECDLIGFARIPVSYTTTSSMALNINKYDEDEFPGLESMNFEEICESTSFKGNNGHFVNAEGRNLLGGWKKIKYPSLYEWNQRNIGAHMRRGYMLPQDAEDSTICILCYPNNKFEVIKAIREEINFKDKATGSKKEFINYFQTFNTDLVNENLEKPFEVIYKVKNTDSKIYTCRHSTYLQYGNGVYHFFTGNSSFPNRDWQSALNDPTYIPADNYTIYGKEDEVLGYGQYGENIAVFKKGNVDNNIYIRTAVDAGELGVVFPVTVGVGGAIGGLSSYTIKNINGETLFLTKEGVYALTSLSLTNMKVTRNRSYYVDGKLLKEPNLDKAIACVWKNKYILAVNRNCYILDGGQPISYRDGSNNDYAYECLFWDNIPATAFMSKDNELYFGTSDGRICKFTDGLYEDDGNDINTFIATKLDDDGNFMAYKKMKKKGTGLLVKPYTKSSFDISFLYDDYEDTYVKTAYADIFNFNNIDFDRFTFETSSNPRIIPFLKKSKKYKSLQILIKSCNKEPFGFMAILKRFTFNNYVKRS